MKRSPLPRKRVGKRFGPMPKPLLERFMAQVPERGIDTKCWMWQGSRDQDGYGHIKIDGRAGRAHRASWLLFRGAIPSQLHVLHTCDNPSCVNPDHLWLGTNADNQRDKALKGRAAVNRTAVKGNRHGTKLTVGDAIAIRALRGVLPYKEVAAQFGIHWAHVHRVWRRENWPEDA